RELRRPVPAPRSGPDRLDRPGQPARPPLAHRGPRGRRRRPRARAEVPRPSLVGPDRPLSARRRRVARQLHAVQIRPAPLQHDRLDQLRPSRSVNLPGAAVAIRHAGRRRDRFRDLSAAHPCDGGHVPPRLVPPQRRQRVHGTRARRLRREAAGLRSGRREPAQLHDRARARRRNLREGERDRHLAADLHPRHDGVHVRDAPADPPDPAGARLAPAPARLHRLLARAEEALRPEAPRPAPMTTASTAMPDDRLDETHDPALRSWVAFANEPGADFPIQNLPFAVFRRRDAAETWRGGVAIGDQIVDLAAAASSDLLEGDARRAAECARGETLNALMALGREPLRALRLALSRVLRMDAPRAAEAAGWLVAQAEAEYRVPARIGDYTDFYASV